MEKPYMIAPIASYTGFGIILLMLTCYTGQRKKLEYGIDLMSMSMGG